MRRPSYACPEVVITAGGTREQIDDVRYIGNFATGELGHTLAETYTGLGFRVLLLAARDVTNRFGRISGVTHAEFSSAANLQEQLLAIPSANLVLQTAAVSDYTPTAVQGKLASDQRELVICMKRTAKILPQLRGHFGAETTLVGFKLLSNVAEAELVEVATQQIQACRTDFCIANDLQDIGVTRRLHIVAPDGTYETFKGSVPDLAIDIAKSIPVYSLI